MSKTQTTLLLDAHVLREAEYLAHSRQETLDQLVEEALRRELQPSTGDLRTPSEPARAGLRLPTHGRGGLLPGVDLEDKESLDRLLGDR